MIEIAKFLIEFLVVFLLIYVLLYVFSYRKIRKFNRNKMPSNVKYLVYKYKIDVVKIGYKKVFKNLMLCDSFIVSFLFSITSFIDNIYIRLLISMILIFPIFAGVYYILVCFYRREFE